MNKFKENVQIIFSFFSNHFELILAIHFACLIIFILLIIAVELSDVAIRSRLYAFLRGAFFISIVIFQMVMMGISISVYWVNYRFPVKEFKFLDDVRTSTQWVRLDIPLYYIQDEKNLQSMTIQTYKKEDIFKGKDPIREYHFSPDGKFMLIATLQELYLVNLSTKNTQLIDSLDLPEFLEEAEAESPPENRRGTFKGIVWAPDSQKFCYESVRWSSFSSQEHVYIYVLADQKRIEIKSPVRRISSLRWDSEGENLYYFYSEAKDTSVSSYPYDVKVFRIPVEKNRQLVSSPTPEFVSQIPSKEASIPLENLELRGITLFPEEYLTFHRLTHKFLFAANSLESSKIDKISKSIISDQGKILGLDDADYLYTIPNKWFKKRLFKIPREPVVSDAPRYSYKGGEPVIYNIRWLPGGRYVILEHKYLGVFILDTTSGKVGHLSALRGEALGWFEKGK